MLAFLKDISKKDAARIEHREFTAFLQCALDLSLFCAQ